MLAICFAIVIIDVFAQDHGTILIKTKEGKSYLAESGKHNYLGDSGNIKETGSDYARG